MYTKASCLGLLAVAGAFFAAGVWLASSGSSPSAGGSLIVEERLKDIGQQAVGHRTVEIRVRNTADKVLRIIGMEGG